jgi:hypothetical protein
MSEIFLSVHQQSPGQVAAPVTLTGQIADPPAGLDRLGHGDLLQGRVVGQDQAGRMLVKTDLGVLKIATPQTLPVGTEVTLQIRHAGSSLQVLILRAQPAPPQGPPPQAPPPQTGAPPAAPPSEADGRAPLPDAVVRGQPIKAIIQAPTGTATPLPGVPAQIAPGTELALRVTSVGTLSTPPAVAAGTPVPGAQTIPAPLAANESSARPAPAVSPPHAASAAQAPPSGASVATNAGVNTGQGTPSAIGVPSRLAAPGSPPGPAAAAQPPAAVSVVEAARSLAVALDSAANKPTVLNAHPIRPGVGAPPSAAVRPLAPAAIATNLPTPSGGEAAPLRITGQVTGMTRAGQPILQTALGIITLATPTNLPAGGSVTLEIVGLSNAATPSTGTATPAHGRAGGGSTALPAPGTGMGVWDGPMIALGDLRLQVPETGPRLAPAILLLLAAIKGGRISNWLAGTDPGDPWGPSGVDGDKPGPDASAFVRRLDNAAGEWRLFLLPLLHAGLRSQVRLYLRSKDGEDATPGVLGRHKATRFVIEAEISSFGGVQLDGFVAAKRFDLNFRSRVPVGPVLRLGIAEIYEGALRSEGWTGQLNFARLGKGGLWGTAQGGSSEVLI